MTKPGIRTPWRSACTAALGLLLASQGALADCTANAGADQHVCGSATFLGGVVPSGATATWSIISGAGGSLTAPSDPTSEFSGSRGTSYTLRQEVTDGSCTQTDDVNITFFEQTTIALAGGNQSNVCETATLAANAATGFNETGTWQIAAGSGSFSDVNDPTAAFTGTFDATHTLRWTISNGVCPSSFDDVDIDITTAPTPNAGTDQLVCGGTTTLAAVLSNGTGTWNILSGAGGTVDTPSAPDSTFSGDFGSTYTLRWTEDNSVCPTASDTVDVTFYDNPTVAAAGADQIDVCGTSTTLAANAAGGFDESGSWSVVAGDGQGGLGDSSSPISSFTGTLGQSYTLRWSISNGVCPITFDNMVVSLAGPVANAGVDQTVAGTSTTLAAAYSTGSSGSWHILGGTGGTLTNASDPNSGFSGNADTTYLLEWTENRNTCSDTDTVQVTFRTVGVTVSPSSGLGTDEDGGQDSFTVVLDGPPNADVTIPVASDTPAEGTTDITSLTFTSGNWDTPQTVTVTGVDDVVDDGDIAYTVVVGDPASADPLYDALGDGDTADVAVTNTDNDDDADGVSTSIEDAVPGLHGGNGDGNGDGVADSTQSHVTSYRASTGDFVTIANGSAASGYNIVQVGSAPAPVDAPTGVQFPFGILEFTIEGLTNGESVSVDVYVPYDPTIDDYYKMEHSFANQAQAMAGNWLSVTPTVTHMAPTKTRLTFTLTDGGPFDMDGAANGSIDDPGGAAANPSAIPLLGGWLLGLLGVMLSGLVGLNLRRRRTH